MKKRLLTSVLALALTVTGLSACGGGGSDTTDDDNIFRLGAIGPLTGELSVYGISTTDAIKMAVEEVNAAGGINGQQIKLTLLDDTGDLTEATNAYERLVSNNKVDAIIGAVTSGPTLGVAQRAADDGMPLITPTGTADSLTIGMPTTFRTCFYDSYQGIAMANYLPKKGYKTVAVLYDNSDEYSVALSNAFIKEVPNTGLTITAQESFGSKDTDFKAQLTKIVASNPEVLYIPAYYETNAMILLQAKEAGFEGLICGADGWDGILTQFKDNPKTADGVIFTNHYSPYDEDPVVKTFVENYRKKYNEDPTAFSALGYDSVYLLKQAVEEAGTKDKAKVIEALEKISFTGVTGSFQFDENHNPKKSVTFVEVKDGIYSLESKQDATE